MINFDQSIVSDGPKRKFYAAEVYLDVELIELRNGSGETAQMVNRLSILSVYYQVKHEMNYDAQSAVTCTI